MKAALDTLAATGKHSRQQLDARSVRTAMEQDALQQAQALLEELDVVVATVRDVQGQVTELHTLARGLQTQDEQVAAEEAALAKTVATALAQRDAAEERWQAVQAFMDRFHLTPRDARLLDEYNFEDLADLDAFLSVLARVRKLRKSPDASSTSPSTLRIMQGLAQQQENAYERLYQWLQTQLQQQRTELPEIPRALHALQAVPAFFQHVLELWAHHTRRTVVTKQFLLALTEGSDTTVPMEVKAHDPVAYVGDMLAFAFKTFSVEGDMAIGILQYEGGDGDEEQEHEESGVLNDGGDDDEDFLGTSRSITAPDLLAISMSGLARPLKSRIFQVIATLARRPDDEGNEVGDDGSDDQDDWVEEEGSIVRNRITHLYDIVGLLLFYKATMEKSLDKLLREAHDGGTADYDYEKNTLIKTMLECIQETTQAYEATTRAYGAMLGQVAAVTGTTEASQVQSMLSQLAMVRQHSPGFNDIPCPDETCARILSTEWSTQTLFDAVHCVGLDDIIALQESVRVSVEVGLSPAAALSLQDSIGAKEQTLIETLVEEETIKVLELCGLVGIVDGWRNWKKSQVDGEASAVTSMAAYPGLSQEAVERSMKDFYASLYSPPLPSLETVVKDPAARRKARSQIATRIGERYAQVYEDLTGPQGGYEDDSFLAHAPDQVKTLFSV